MGAIIRGDLHKREIALVFTGDEFADGGRKIQKTLKKHSIKGSFFFTGNFYARPGFRQLIRTLKLEGHYLGPHSDKHLLYADWVKRDSLMVTEDQFKKDLEANYKKMAGFNIDKSDARYFIPPYEWYNKTTVLWTNDMGLKLVNFSPGTRSTADYTYPEMGKSYRSSAEIYDSIISIENSGKDRLNGFILLLHIGTDPRRKDKFYAHLGKLITELKSRNYTFLKINELLDEK